MVTIGMLIYFPIFVMLHDPRVTEVTLNYQPYIKRIILTYLKVIQFSIQFIISIEV